MKRTTVAAWLLAAGSAAAQPFAGDLAVRTGAVAGVPAVPAAAKPEDSGRHRPRRDDDPLFFAALSGAGARYPWEEYGKRLASARQVAALGSEAFGDRVGLQAGELSFTATDVSIPGNNALEVAFVRRYAVEDRRHSATDGMLADWTLELPSLSGTFATEWIGGSADVAARCTDASPPPLPIGEAAFPEKVHSMADFWNGLRLQLPGQEGGELLAAEAGIQVPADGRAYRWTTNTHTRVACLPSIRNGAGQGFLAVAADGTRYWFDWMAEQHAPDLRTLHRDAAGARYAQFLERRRFVLHATRVEDRHGNWVAYAYANQWNEPARLTGITASDGRALTVTYGSNGHVDAVSDGSRSWRYVYAATPSGRTTLARVVLPDASAWTIGFAAFTDAELRYLDYSPPGEPRRSCTVLELPQNLADTPVGTLVHPAGAVGTFTVDIREHGRSNVPVHCTNVTTDAGMPPGTGNDPNDDANLVAISHHAFTLASKRVSGPGLPATEWTYRYVPGIAAHYYPGTSEQYPVCTLGAACYDTPCRTDACAGTSQTVVQEGTAGRWSRYTFGNSYRYNEGKLLRVERGVGTVDGTPASITDHAYDLSLADGAYPARWGRTLQANGDGFAAEFHRPQLAQTITQEGVSFRRQVAPSDFDAFARALRVTRSSVLGTRVDTTEYHHDAERWVIDQVARTTAAGIETERTEFDAASRPWKLYRFGKLRQTLAYNTDGTIAMVHDGRGAITALSGWKRGIPQVVAFPDGASRTIDVDNAGLVVSATDEAAARTCYAYDAMGRLASVTHPSESASNVCDTSRWAPTTQAFQPVPTAEFGVEPGHWRQTTSTGNARRITYYDGLWRPVLVREYDAADIGGTSRFVARAYDEDGRETFLSYPVASAATITDITQGTRTTYDALGRRDVVRQDSELGALTTDTDYLAGFRTRVTNPRGHATSTSYLAFDEPVTEWPVAIVHPEGAFTDIPRDPLGRTRSLTRRNADGSVTGTRRYVYDTSGGELCKVVEPESGATVMDHDGAGNLAWSAAGLQLPEDRCDHGSALASGRRVSRTYDARNRLATLTYPDNNGNQTWTWYATGQPRQVTTTNDGGATSVTNLYLFNRRGLLTSESQVGDNTWTVSYGHDANGHQTSLGYPAGLALSLAVNALGQTTAVSSATRTYASGVRYHPNGAVRQFTYGNGIVHTLAQNARGLAERREDRLGNVVALDESYDYDGNGNVLAISDGQTGARGDRTMAYDGLDRLTTASSPVFGVATYGYDVLDNLTRVVAPNRNHTYWYDPATWRLTNIIDAVTGASTSGLGYDAQGNLQNRNGAIFGFDFGNRLRSAGAEKYRYDAYGRRVLADRQGAGRIHSLYGRDGALLWQRDERAGKRTQHIHLAGRLIAQRTRPIGADVPETITYHHTDALGSLVAATTPGRVLLQASEYEPYGKLSNRAPDDGPGYTGHVGDSATGLVYMQQRYYDPQIGRFLSVDPVPADPSTGANFNRYWYGNDNPYRWTDPDGRLGCTGTHLQRLCGNPPGASIGPVGDVRSGASGLAKVVSPSPPHGGRRYHNPTDGRLRGCDGYGCGHHGARRDGGRRRHDGADYVSRPGQPVVSPADGRVQRVSMPYKDDDRYSGVLIRGSDGNAVNVWYIAPDAGVVGNDVAAGDRIGVAQDLRAKYGAAMTNHVHVRITNPAGGAIDPATLIPAP